MYLAVPNIERLMAKFPQLSSPEHGGITGNPTKAALDPAKAPWFVAAYRAEQIQSHDRAELPVTHQELIQKYNPGGRVHFDHVHEQLIWIKTNHAVWESFELERVHRNQEEQLGRRRQERLGQEILGARPLAFGFLPEWLRLEVGCCR